MYELEELSFYALETRELFKGWSWWLGFAVAVLTAAYAYVRANPT